MMESVYVETTIISYLVSRPSRDLLVAAHQQITHEWWDRQRPLFECYISEVVVDEIRAGDDKVAQRRMEAAGGSTILGVAARAEALTKVIVESGAIPVQAVRDAAHLAITAVNDIDYLLTWNCRHLANGQIIRAVSAICAARGFRMPVVCTPEELMGV
ncbi:MAG: type II toxin-antitoxin system VapC family toxin [Planctomycetes bacterium]|nr:type II toxin-antitoxin system VapC family toxin [Planctomycetota bacterium]